MRARLDGLALQRPLELFSKASAANASAPGSRRGSALGDAASHSAAAAAAEAAASSDPLTATGAGSRTTAHASYKQLQQQWDTVLMALEVASSAVIKAETLCTFAISAPASAMDMRIALSRSLRPRIEYEAFGSRTLSDNRIKV